MSQNSLNETIKTIGKYLIQNQQRMVREEDLKNLCPSSVDFNQLISPLYTKYKEIGIELISSNFLGEKYYILTMEGKDKSISPGQYGILALLIAYSNEIDENMNLSEIKEIFSDVWTTDIQIFLDQDYLRIITMNDHEVMRVTPLGKSLLKNIIKDLKLKNLMELFENPASSLQNDKNEW